MRNSFVFCTYWKQKYVKSISLILFARTKKKQHALRRILNGKESINVCTSSNTIYPQTSMHLSISTSEKSDATTIHLYTHIYTRVYSALYSKMDLFGTFDL